MLSQMEKQQYSKYNLDNHRYIYNKLHRFVKSTNNGLYTPDVGKDFIANISSRTPPLSPIYFSVYVNAIHRLNHILGELNWRPPGNQPEEYAHSCFDEIVREHERYLKKSGKPDVRPRCRTVSRFLKFVESYGITDLKNLTIPCIHAAFENATDKMNFQRAISIFLRSAHRYSLIAKDLSLIIPSVKKHIPVPSVYSVEEVELLLSYIDRSSPVGKRNYAIVLIAARLGLRACDICALTFENINYTKSSIELVQSKT